MVVVCPPGHPLARHEAVTAEHLQGMDFIGFDRDLSIRKEIDRYLRQRSINIRVAMEFDNIETIKQAVQIGAGVSILPEPTVRDEVRNGSLATVRLIAPELYRPIGIIHRQRRVFTPTAAKFVELLQQVQNHRAGGDVMRDTEVLVRFRPSGREAYVLPGTRLVEAAAEAGLVLEVPCGGEGLCGKCRVIVTSGAGEPTAVERQLALGRGTPRGLAAGVPVGRRAGRRRSRFRRAVRPPRNSKILVHAGSEAARICRSDGTRLRPRLAIRRCGSGTSSFPPPARGDDLPDAAAAGAGAGRRAAGRSTLPLLRELPARLRETDFRGTAVLAEQSACWTSSRATPKPTPSPWPFDLGTTTLVGRAVGPGHGQRVGRRRRG